MRLAGTRKTERERILGKLSQPQLNSLIHDWPGFWARPNQLPPATNWSTWLYLAGRGAGKTRSGAEWVQAQARGQMRRIALVAPTAADVRDVMVQGESGILSVAPDDFRPVYIPSKRRLTWPNGAIATTYSAEEPERLRGPQHDAAWCDELASWRYPEAWDMLMFGLRLGNDPRVVVTTTPKPTKIIRELLGDPTVAVTRGSTYENRANLPDKFFAQIIKKYEGTRLGRQELNAELLDDVPGALWTRDQIERLRIAKKDHPQLRRIVVAIDPATTSGEDADETGIIVAGKDDRGHGYVLDDLSGRYPPNEWAKTAITAYRDHRADRIVAEINNGGEMVENTLRVVDPNIAYSAVHATRGKVIRAEPVSMLYEQHRVHHVGGFPQLEDQMCEFTTDFDPDVLGYSPDRVDALVWAMTELLVEPMPSYGIWEATRLKAETLAAQKKPADKPAPTFAPGSMEYAQQQRELTAATAGSTSDKAAASPPESADVRDRIADRIARLTRKDEA